MAQLWGAQRKHATWRQLWVALAEAEAELGLAVTPEQIAQLKDHVDDINFEAARKYEHQLRHDVMAHVHTFGAACPQAAPIIHLGATSMDVVDNTDALRVKQSLTLIRARVTELLAAFATESVARLKQAKLRNKIENLMITRWETKR